MKMRIKSILSYSLVALGLISTSCTDEVTSDNQLELNISGLEDLGSDYVYEGWIIVDGAPVTTGVFSVNESGQLSKTSFDVDNDQLDAATKFVLTIEPAQDPDPAPSAVHIVAGDFSAGSASLDISDPAALNTDFAEAAGGYFLATPTDGPDSDERSGIWFLDPALGPGPSLTLPVLPEGWAYEGWAVSNGTPITTGTFTSVSGADDAAPYSGDLDGPPFPGEDFLVNAPSDLMFPLDLAGGVAVISVEPVPDNSPMPFLLKPLVADIPSDAADHTLLGFGQNLAFPTGTAVIK